MSGGQLRGVVADEHLQELRRRNAERAKQLIQGMGRKYALSKERAPAKGMQRPAMSLGAVLRVMFPHTAA